MCLVVPPVPAPYLVFGMALRFAVGYFKKELNSFEIALARGPLA